MHSISPFRRTSLMLSVFALIALAGCGDDDSPTNPGDPGGSTATGSVSCTLNGVATTFDDAPGGVEDGNGMLVLGASAATGSDGALLTVTDAVGTYALGTPGDDNLTLTIGTSVYMTSGQTGTLTVSSVSNTRVEGTFSGTAVNPLDGADILVITGGTFDIPLARLP